MCSLERSRSTSSGDTGQGVATGLKPEDDSPAYVQAAEHCTREAMSRRPVHKSEAANVEQLRASQDNCFRKRAKNRRLVLQAIPACTA